MRRIFLVSSATVFFTIFLVTASLSGRTKEDFNPLFFPSLELPAPEQKPFLGIFMSEVPEEKAPEGVKKNAAVYIDHVMKESAADKAGLKTGDIVIAVDGKDIEAGGEESPTAVLRKAVREKKIGDVIRLTVIREEKRFEVEALLGRRRKIPAPEKAHPRIEEARRSFTENDSELYRLISDRSELDSFLKTLSALGEWSFYLDSFKVSEENLLRLGEINYILKNPLNIVPLAREVSEHFTEPADMGLPDIPALMAAASEELDGFGSGKRAYYKTFRGLDDIVDYMAKKLARAKSIMEEALRELTGDELASLKNISSPPMPDYSTERWEAFLRAAAKVDYIRLLESIEEASLALSPPVIEALKNWSETLSGDEEARIIETKAGRVIIGSPGPDRHRKDALIIIDPGGDDIYTNRAGGSSERFPFSVVIDLKGDDLYISHKSPAQGSGFMGMGALVDISGSDTYIAGSGSQGSAILGGGLLIDLEGDDSYTMELFGQGAGLLGAGLLIDKKGADIYKADLMAQGFGSIRAVGALIDLSGDDLYTALGRYPDERDPEHATMSFSQGFSMGLRPYDTPLGAPGGIGMLIDREGNDRYAGDYFSQGGGYWYSLGILRDMAGDDSYSAGRYSQGAGIHTAAGLLMDEGGDDSYSVDVGVAQGMGHDFGVGVLFEKDGSDAYRGGFLSQGRATCGGLGFLYDKKGKDGFGSNDSDRGVTEADDSCGARGFGFVLR